MKTVSRQNALLCSACFFLGNTTILRMHLCYVALVQWFPIDFASFLWRIKQSLQASILEPLFFILSSRQTLHVCSEIVSGCFWVLLGIVLVKPVYSPKAACVRPDRFRQSRPLTMPLPLNFFADLADRQTLRVCGQIASGPLKRLYCALCLFANRYVAAASALLEID